MQERISSENDRILMLEKLVDELTKEDASEAELEHLMKQVGIEFTSDPVQRINRVLLALHRQ